MHITGQFKEPQFAADGTVHLVIEVNERSKALEEYETLQGEKLTVDIEKFRKKRSLDANAYFWQLVDKIGKKIGVDKWDVYLMQIDKYGVFDDVMVRPIAVESLRQHFRYSVVLDEKSDFCTVRCYYGSSEYDSKEMSDLINGTVQDAHDLGIETLTPDEINLMLKALERKVNDRNMATSVSG